MRYFVIGTTLLAMALAPAGIAQQTKIKKVEAAYTKPGSGSEMFQTYCAVCHGMDGKGNGPAATALNTAPADLTLLAQKHDGKFPKLEVRQFILGDSSVAAHGTRDMPMWGDILKSVGPGTDGLVTLRVRNLSDYIEGMQQK
ncbi:MAG: c-type cytochrome [Acidobacteriota bacterium]|nr:c-type cytochrome [Acidobacteriota bacterium]